jgi:hypothetical protein
VLKLHSYSEREQTLWVPSLLSSEPIKFVT